MHKAQVPGEELGGGYPQIPAARVRAACGTPSAGDATLTKHRVAACVTGDNIGSQSSHPEGAGNQVENL